MQSSTFLVTSLLHLIVQLFDVFLVEQLSTNVDNGDEMGSSEGEMANLREVCALCEF